MQAWKRVEPTMIQKVGFRTVVTKTFVLPDGRTQAFDTTGSEDFNAVAIVAITADAKVLVFRQFRPGPERIMEETPGGMVDKGEDIEVAARRELLEETGYKPGKMIYLGKSAYDCYANGTRNAFLALDCTPADEGHSREPNEQDGELLEISIDQLIKNAKEARMTDPGAVLLAYDELMKLKEK